MYKYQDPFSTDKRNTVFIDANDPRAQSWNLGKTESRMGRDVEVVKNSTSIINLNKYIEPTISLAPKFIATTYAGKVLHSENGINWTEKSLTLDGSPVSYLNVQKMIYVQDKYVGIVPFSGAGYFVYSENGFDWTITKTLSVRPIDVTYGNGKFVTVVDGPNSYYSDDAITWTNGPILTTDGGPITPPSFQLKATNISYFDSDFVIPLNSYTSGASYPISASDATSWAYLTYAYNSIFLEKINGYYIAFYEGEYIIYSSDKITWSSFTNTLLTDLRDIIYADGVYVAVGSQGISYSTNLSTWTISNIGAGNDFVSVTYADGKFVAGGIPGIYYSSDGITWTIGDFTPISSPNDNIMAVSSKDFDFS